MTSSRTPAVNSKVDDFIMHYASQYYDPIKAHQYYEEHKKLVGRNSGPKLSKESRQKQVEASFYVKNQISTKRNAELTKAAADKKANLEKLKATADATRDRIVSKLNDLIDSLKVTVEPPGEREIVPEIPVTLNKIPPNASPQIRSYLERQNRAKTAKARTQRAAAQKKADSDYKVKADAYKQATSEASANAKAGTAEAKAQMTKVGTDLKAAIAEVRATYTSTRTATVNKYKNALTTETKNIQQKVR